MIGRLAFLAALIIASGAPAAPTITIEPRRDVYLDDLIVMTIIADAGVRPDAFRFRIANGRELRRSAVPSASGEDPRESFSVRILANAPGPLAIEGEWSTAAGETYRIPPIHLTVLPDLGRSSENIGEVFRTQRETGHHPVVVRTRTKKSQYYAGEDIEIEWFAIEADKELSAGPPPVNWLSIDFHWPRDPVYIGAAEAERDDRYASRGGRTVEGGVFVMRQPLAGYIFNHPTPGIVEVPPRAIYAQVHPINSRDPRVNIVRWSNALTITIVDPPAKAKSLPVGDFTIQCRKSALGYWPEVDVEVQGRGDLREAPPPHFVISPISPTVIRRVSARDSRHARQWRYSIHATGTSARLPPLEFPFFSPTTGSNEVARCTGIALGNLPLRTRDEEEAGGINRLTIMKPPDPEQFEGYLLPFNLIMGLALAGGVSLLVAAYRD